MDDSARYCASLHVLSVVATPAGSLPVSPFTLRNIPASTCSPETHLWMQASLEADQYDLASELLRFLIPPGDNDILAAMPSNAPMPEHSNGKLAQSPADHDAGVSS